MTTLIQSPLSTLIEKLFNEADASEDTLKQKIKQLSPAERATEAGSPDYRKLYTRFKDFPIPVSRETGKLLYLLACSIQARTIIEFGTSFGISTLHLAAALKDNGGGRLIGSEFEPSKVVRARQNLIAGDLSDLVEIREGDALETLSRDLPESIDFVFLDGAKDLYSPILSLLENQLRIGAIVVADNANSNLQYLAHVRSATQGYLSTSIDNRVELSMRIGKH